MRGIFCTRCKHKEVNTNIHSSIRCSLRARLHWLCLLLLCLISTAPLRAQQTASHLSNNDARRYQYFFFEGNIKEMQNQTEAMDLYLHAAEINPDAPEVWFALVSYYYSLGQNDKALECIERAAKLDPDNSAYQERLAQVYILNKKDAEAITALERLYTTDLSRTDVLHHLLQLYGAENNFDKMIDVLNRIEVVEGPSEETTLTKMQVYDMQGKKNKSYDELHALCTKYPGNLNYQIMMGNWLLQNERKAEALKIYQQVLEKEPDNELANMSILDYYLAVGDTLKADRTLSLLLQSSATSIESKEALLKQAYNRYCEISDSTTMLRFVNEALSTPQTNDDIYMFKAACLTYYKKKEDDIVPVLEQALAVEPDNSSARLRVVIYKAQQRDHQGVIALCQPAIEMHPDEMAFYFYKGLAEYELKLNDEALATTRSGLACSHENQPTEVIATMYSIIGEILYDKGQHKEAYEAYDSCLQYRPDDALTLNNYAYYLALDHKDLKKAEQMSYKTVQAEPTNSTYLDTYAWILFCEKRYQEAKIYIDQAIQNDSTLSNIYVEHAGDIYFMAQEPDKALDLWKQAAKSDPDNALLQKKIKLKKYIEK